jgi:hypothetical protein
MLTIVCTTKIKKLTKAHLNAIFKAEGALASLLSIKVLFVSMIQMYGFGLLSQLPFV